MSLGKRGSDEADLGNGVQTWGVRFGNREAEHHVLAGAVLKRLNPADVDAGEPHGRARLQAEGTRLGHLQV